MTTASMIKAARTGLGSLEKSGARDQQGEKHDHAGSQGRKARTGPGMVVERAGRQAGGHGHALEKTGTDVGHSLSHRFLIYVDAIAVLGGEGPRVSGGL